MDPQVKAVMAVQVYQTTSLDLLCFMPAVAEVQYSMQLIQVAQVAQVLVEQAALDHQEPMALPTPEVEAVVEPEAALVVDQAVMALQSLVIRVQHKK
jgi:hypothetical protein